MKKFLYFFLILSLLLPSITVMAAGEASVNNSVESNTETTDSNKTKLDYDAEIVKWRSIIEGIKKGDNSQQAFDRLKDARLHPEKYWDSDLEEKEAERGALINETYNFIFESALLIKNKLKFELDESAPPEYKELKNINFTLEKGNKPAKYYLPCRKIIDEINKRQADIIMYNLVNTAEEANEQIAFFNKKTHELYEKYQQFKNIEETIEPLNIDNLKDGEYWLDFNVYMPSVFMNPDDGLRFETSMMNEATVKPAKLIVRDGKKFIRIKMIPMAIPFGEEYFAGFMAWYDYFPDLKIYKDEYGRNHWEGERVQSKSLSYYDYSDKLSDKYEIKYVKEFEFPFEPISDEFVTDKLPGHPRDTIKVTLGGVFVPIMQDFREDGVKTFKEKRSGMGFQVASPTFFVDSLEAIQSPADNKELIAKIEEAVKIDLSNKTDETKIKFEEELEAAKKVVDNPVATQDEIDNALNALTKAMVGLVDKEPENLDYKNLPDGKYKVDIKIKNYVTPTQLSMADGAVVKFATIVVENGKYSLKLRMKPLQRDFGGSQFTGYLGDMFYSETMDTNIEKLKRVNIHSYYDEKDNFFDIFKKYAKEHYPQIPIEELKYPKELSYPIAKPTEREQETLVRVFVPVMEAISPSSGFQFCVPTILWDTLVEQSKLEAKIKEADAIDLGNKTDNTKMALEEALKNAKEVVEKQEPTQEEVDNALKALDAAIKGLEEKPAPAPVEVDKSKLEAKIKEALLKEKGKKTDSAFRELQNAIKLAQDKLNANNQQVIDKAVDDLDQAILLFNNSKDMDITPPVNPNKPSTNDDNYYKPSKKYKKSRRKKEQTIIAIEKNKVVEDIKTEDIKAVEKVYPDIKDHWAAKAVAHAEKKGYFKNIADNNFKPEKPITRAEFVTVLGRMAGINIEDYKANSFKDVDINLYYSYFINWAKSKGIVVGYEDGTFKPDKEITREEMAVLIDRFIKIENYKLEQKEGKTYADNDKVADWAIEHVKNLTKYSIVNGIEGNEFAPKGIYTRAQMAQVAYNLDNSK